MEVRKLIIGHLGSCSKLKGEVAVVTQRASGSEIGNVKTVNSAINTINTSYSMLNCYPGEHRFISVCTCT